MEEEPIEAEAEVATDEAIVETAGMDAPETEVVAEAAADADEATVESTDDSPAEDEKKSDDG